MMITRIPQSIVLIALITISMIPFASAVEVDGMEIMAKEFAPMGREREAPTTLLVDLVLVGDSETDGSTFHAVGHVTNIGRETAYNVQSLLIGNWPRTWVVDPDYRTMMGDIAPGETKSVRIEITRDHEDATLLLMAKGDNTELASSDRVRAPVHAAIIAGVAVSMIGLMAVRRKELAEL